MCQNKLLNPKKRSSNGSILWFLRSEPFTISQYPPGPECLELPIYVYREKLQRLVTVEHLETKPCWSGAKVWYEGVNILICRYIISNAFALKAWHVLASSHFDGEEPVRSIKLKWLGQNDTVILKEVRNFFKSGG